jgi:hypothetical protein
MNKLLKVIKTVYLKNSKEDWDTWHAVVGDEGEGKTHLNLWLLETWYTMLYGKVTKKDIRHFSMDTELWKKDLSRLKPLECSVYDEAGALNNRRTMSKFNVEITQLARVIRGDNNYIILTIQDLFDLDPFFAKRRIRGLIYVYKRGHFAYYSKQRIRTLVALNRPLYVKNYWIVKPTFTERYPKYKGPLLKPYLEMKGKYIKEAKAKLIDSHTLSQDPSFNNWLRIMRMKHEGLTDKEIAEVEGKAHISIVKFRNEYVDKIKQYTSYGAGA